MLRDCSSTGNESVLSDSSHNIVEKYSYDVFGKPTIRNSQGNIITTSAYGNRFMFTGREYDSESGLYYYRARNYSPWIGRFLQTDPIGYAAGLNLYTYCGNNPIIYIDPYGLKYWEPVVGRIGDFAGGVYDYLGGRQGEVYWGGGARALGGVGTMILSGSYIYGSGGLGGLARGGAGFGWGCLQWNNGLKMMQSSLYNDNWQQYLNRPGEDALRGAGDVTAGLMLKDALTVAQGVEGLVLSVPQLIAEDNRVSEKVSEQSQNFNSPADPVDVKI